MALAIFDLDNTLIGGDSDYLWGQFVCEQGLVDSAQFTVQNEAFFEDYKAGQLDIDAYLRFALSPLKGLPMERLSMLHQQFMGEKITPIMLPKAQKLIDNHRKRGDTLLIITATNAFITRPIANALGIAHLVACEGEIIDGIYTGEPKGTPSFGQGKVTRLSEWIAGTEHSMKGAYFYSDSHNDLPLLERVDKPIAVDPDDTLRARAEELDWPVISLRG